MGPESWGAEALRAPFWRESRKGWGEDDAVSCLPRRNGLAHSLTEALAACPQNRPFCDTDRRRKRKEGKPRASALYTRLTNLCVIYSMKREKKGTRVGLSSPRQWDV